MPNFSPNLLSKVDFYNYTGFTSTDINDLLLAKIIDNSNSIINKGLGELFNFQTDYVKYFQPSNSKSVFAIGWWQRTALAVSLIKNGNETVLNETNYILKYEDDHEKVFGLVLRYQNLCEKDEIKLKGTFGYSNGFPEELNFLSIEIYKIIKKAILEDQNET